MSKKVLGRGLEALITPVTEGKEKEYVDNINVHKIKPNKFQPRANFNTKKLQELIDSIDEKGVIQPIIVRDSEDGYELIAGERRLRAAKTLGFTEIPAIVKKEIDDINALQLSLIENIQRDELNPLEEAQAYKRLVDEFNFTQDKIGQAVGKDRATISNSLRILGLPKKVLDLLANDQITAGHAKALLSAVTAQEQLKFAKEAVNAGLSVRALEQLMRKKPGAKKSDLPVDHNIRLLQEKMQEKLGTKVKIIRGKRRSTVQIEFYSDADLQKILKFFSCE